MSQARILNLVWPMAGVVRSDAYTGQKPFTCIDALNVRPDDTIKGRERGGSRPGLSQSQHTQLGDGAPVRLLDAVNYIANDSRDVWIDTFRGRNLASHWSTSSGSGLTVRNGYVERTASAGGAIRAALPEWNTAQPWRWEMRIVPHQDTHQGTYTLLAYLASTPQPAVDCLRADLTLAADGTYSGTLKKLVAGVETSWSFAGAADTSAKDGWFTLELASSGGVARCLWRGSQLISQNVGMTPAGHAFGVMLTPATSGSRCLVDRVRMQYYRTGDFELDRPLLVASSNGVLYRESWLGEFEAVSSSLEINATRRVQSTDRGQKLYIADGTLVVADEATVGGISIPATTKYPDWTASGVAVGDLVQFTKVDPVDAFYHINLDGEPVVAIEAQVATVTDVALGLQAVPPFSSLQFPGATAILGFRVVRKAKVYDPQANTIDYWTAEKGAIPHACRSICRWMDRIILCDDPGAPHVFYASRQGFPLDFDYAGEGTGDVGRAVAGGLPPAGSIGDPIRVAIPLDDDALLFGCRNSIWVQRGDFTAGANPQRASALVGVVSRTSWCWGPGSQLFFLSGDGVYTMHASGSGLAPLSRERLPNELLDLDGERYTISMAYDLRGRVVQIWVVNNATGTGEQHWELALPSGSFWPVEIPSTMQPTAIAVVQSADPEEAAVLLGGLDGRVRRYRDDARRDDGTAFTSSLTIGPLRLAGDGWHDAMVAELLAELGQLSGTVGWELRMAQTAEEAADLEAAASATGSWASGLSYRQHPRVRGVGCTLRLHSSTPWAMERITMLVRRLGKQRVT